MSSPRPHFLEPLENASRPQFPSESTALTTTRLQHLLREQSQSNQRISLSEPRRKSLLASMHSSPARLMSEADMINISEARAEIRLNTEIRARAEKKAAVAETARLYLGQKTNSENPDESSHTHEHSQSDLEADTESSSCFNQPAAGLNESSDDECAPYEEKPSQPRLGIPKLNLARAQRPATLLTALHRRSASLHVASETATPSLNSGNETIFEKMARLKSRVTDLDLSTLDLTPSVGRTSRTISESGEVQLTFFEKSGKHASDPTPKTSAPSTKATTVEYNPRIPVEPNYPRSLLRNPRRSSKVTPESSISIAAASSEHSTEQSPRSSRK